MAARRVTPVRLVSDVAATVAVYEQQGFRALPTDEPGCVGLMADATRTGLMLLGRDYADRSMPAEAVAELGAGTGLYIWVDNLVDVESSGTVLGEMTTAYGTRERFVREDSGLVAYAETISS
jgi:hypothetical protein